MMKLIVLYEKELIGKQRLFPRDIRNYIGSISGEADKEYTMWHKREIPHLIYMMPNRKGFAIVSYIDDDFTKGLFNRILSAIKQNPVISFKNANVKTEVKEAYIINYGYKRLTPQYEERRLKTPMLMRQFARAKSITRDVKDIDMQELEKLVSDEIKESIAYMNRDWFGKEVDLDDLMLVYKDLKYTVVKYKEDQYFPAVYGTIIANKKLPDFIGYNIGLGYGELEQPKVTQRRGR
jgi:hypothetical protein